MDIKITGYSNQSYKNKVSFGVTVPKENLVRTIGACYSSALFNPKDKNFNTVIRTCDSITGGNARKDGLLLAPEQCAARLLEDEPSVITSVVRLTIGFARRFFGANGEITRTPEKAEQWVKWATANLDKIIKTQNIKLIDPPKEGIAHEILSAEPPEIYFQKLDEIDALPECINNSVKGKQNWIYDTVVGKAFARKQ